MRATAPPPVTEVALSLVGCALAVKLHAQLGQPDRARAEMHRALDLLAVLEDRLPHEQLDPLDAPAPAVPVRQENRP